MPSVTAEAACPGRRPASWCWLVWGVGRRWATWRRRRHELLVARARAEAEVRTAEIQAELREQESANEAYQEFVRRHPLA